MDPAESTVVNTELSRENIHESGVVDCIKAADIRRAMS